jgi:hypothetical protein
MSDRKKHYDVLKRLYRTHGDLAYLLAVFGDHIAQREGYKSLEGMDAVHYYVIAKFKWLPRDVRSMSYDDLRLVLTEELEGWVAPEEAR